MKERIVEVVSTNSEVKIKLANGVVVDISSQPGYIHLSFSGINDDKRPVVSMAAKSDIGKKYPISNYCDIEYTPGWDK